jgi:hypothetical protein
MRYENNVTAKARRARRKTRRRLEVGQKSLPFASVFALFVSSRWYLILLIGLMGADSPPTPFYYASSTVFDKQVATLIVGVNERIGQAVVSQDRKHVTLNMDASLLGNGQISQFAYQRGGMGFVGSAGAPAAGGNAAVGGAGSGNGLTPSVAASPGEIAPQVTLLDKPGMVLIEPLER